MVPRPLNRIHLAAVAALAVFAPIAHAAERVSLQNGFALSCDHHAMINGNTRLFLSADEGNYIDLPSRQIAAFEAVPDLPSDRGADSPAPKSDRTALVAPAKPLRQTQPSLSAADLDQMLSRAGAGYDVDVDLLASIVKAESNGNVRAMSRAGAAGLMQLMPSTASDLGVRDRFDPAQNVRGGSAYIDFLLTRYRDNLALALAAYNAGPQAVDKYHGVPPYAETRAYVARVIHEFNRRVLARQAGPLRQQSRLSGSSASSAGALR